MVAYRKSPTQSYGYQQNTHQADEKPRESKLERCVRLCQVLPKLPSLSAFFDFQAMFTVPVDTPVPSVPQLSMMACLLDISAGIPQETAFNIHGILPGYLSEWKALADAGDPFYGKWFDFLLQAPFVAERSAIAALRIYFDSRSALEWLKVHRPAWNIRGNGGGIVYDPMAHMTEEQAMKELQELGNVTGNSEARTS